MPMSGSARVQACLETFSWRARNEPLAYSKWRCTVGPRHPSRPQGGTYNVDTQLLAKQPHCSCDQVTM